MKFKQGVGEVTVLDINILPSWQEDRSSDLPIKKLHLAFIDFCRAFDVFESNKLWNVLEKKLVLKGNVLGC